RPRPLHGAAECTGPRIDPPPLLVRGLAGSARQVNQPRRGHSEGPAFSTSHAAAPVRAPTAFGSTRMKSELDQLVNKWIEGELEPEDAETLRELLAENPSARETCYDLLLLDQLLVERED